jgi:hypothetical protein
LLIKKLNVLERIGLSKSELEQLPGQTSSKRVDYSGGAASGGRRQASITSYLVPAANQSSNSADTEDFESAFDYIDENELEALMADFPC